MRLYCLTSAILVETFLYQVSSQNAFIFIFAFLLTIRSAALRSLLFHVSSSTVSFGELKLWQFSLFYNLIGNLHCKYVNTQKKNKGERGNFNNKQFVGKWMEIFILYVFIFPPFHIRSLQTERLTVETSTHKIMRSINLYQQRTM